MPARRRPLATSSLARPLRSLLTNRKLAPLRTLSTVKVKVLLVRSTSGKSGLSSVLIYVQGLIIQLLSDK